MLNALIYKRNFRMVTTNLLFWFGAYLFLPVLPLFYGKLGMNSKEIGCIIGAYSLGAILFRLFAGRLADTYGCKLVAVTGLILSVCAVCGYFYLDAIFAILLFRFLHGVGSAGYSSSAITMVTLTNTKEHVKEAVSLYTLSSMLGISVATSIAIFIYDLSSYYMVVVLALCSIITALLLFPKKSHENHNTHVLKEVQSIKRVVSNKFVLMSTLNQFTVYLCYGSMMTFLPLFLYAHGVKHLWTFYFAYSITVFSSRFLAAYLCEFIKMDRLILCILFLFAAAMLFPLLNISWWVLTLAGLSSGISVGLATPILTSMIVTHVQASNRGTALGFFSTSIDIGMGVGSIFMGLVVARFGYIRMFSIISVYTIGVSIFYLFWMKQKKTEIQDIACETISEG